MIQLQSPIPLDTWYGPDITILHEAFLLDQPGQGFIALVDGPDQPSIVAALKPCRGVFTIEILEDYAVGLEEAGLWIETMREPRPAGSASIYQRWKRVPMFLSLRAIKPQTEQAVGVIDLGPGGAQE